MLILYDENGKPIGKKSNKNYIYDFLIRKNYIFPSTGVYTLLVTHGMRAVSYTHLDVYKRQIHTPIGRYGGALSNVRTDNLTVLIIKAVLARNLHVDCLLYTSRCV